MAVKEYNSKKVRKGKFINEVGNVYGRLTVLSEGERAKSGTIKWNCICECGNTVSVRGDILRNGSTKSCKCLNNEIAIKTFTKHGMSRTTTYRAFYNMLHRCYRKSHKNYDFYGGRGIKVCDRWVSSFDNFFADMGEKPDGMTLDRIDNDKDYSQDNCRWANSKEQSRNTSRNVNLNLNGKIQCREDWSNELGIPSNTIKSRINKLGWSVIKSMTTPVQFQNRKII